jgi:hypothetical protein
MNVKSISLVVATSLSGWSLVHADITAVTDWGYSGGIYCYTPLWDSAGSVGIDGYQSGLGQMGGMITTSDAVDPTLTINNSINNDSGFAWTGYIVDVFLNTNFSISFPAVPVSNPSGWAAGVIIPVHFDSGSGLWTGTIDYTGGTPVSPVSGDPNNEFDFAYKVTFGGLTQYSLTESVTPVPEPGAFSLLMIGGLVLGGRVMAGCRPRKLRVEI